MAQAGEGSTAEGLLRPRGRLAPLEAARVARDVARELAALHARSVTGVDLSPRNVALGADGVAALLDRTGHAGADAQTDLRALGGLLHHLLVGRPASEDWPPLAHVPEPVVDVLEQLLEPVLPLRYARATEALADLERALAGQAVERAALVAADGRSLVLRRGVDHVVVGRDPTCTLAFPGLMGLGRRHAELRRTARGFELSDLDSTCGTLVDGRQIPKRFLLHDGARLRIGRVDLVFRDPRGRGGRPVPPAPAPEVAHASPAPPPPPPPVPPPAPEPEPAPAPVPEPAPLAASAPPPVARTGDVHDRAEAGDPEACRALGQAAERLGDPLAAYLQYYAGSRSDPALEREARRLGDPIAVRQRPALEALRGRGVRVATTRRFHEDGRPFEWQTRLLVEVLRDPTPRPALELSGEDLRDEDLAHVSDLDTLRWLRVTSARVTDRGAAALARLRLTSLSLLGRPALTDAGLAALAAIDSLEAFDCDGERFTRAGLLALFDARPALGVTLPGRFCPRERQPFSFGYYVLEEWAQTWSPARRRLARSATRALLAAETSDQREAALFALLMQGAAEGRLGYKQLMVVSMGLKGLLERPDLVAPQLPALVELACGELGPDAFEARHACEYLAVPLLEEWLRRGLPFDSALAARLAERREASRWAERLHAQVVRQGRLRPPVRAALEALAPRVERHDGLLRLLERVLDCGDPGLADAAGRAAQGAAAASSPWQAPALVELLTRVLDTPPAPGLRSAAAELLGRAAGQGGDLAPALPGLVEALDDPDVAYRAGAALEAAVAKGADLGWVLGALERRVSAPRWTAPLGPAAEALSAYLVRIGREVPLPKGSSHRRTLAWVDAPDGEARSTHRCGVCKRARLVCIFSSESEDEYAVEACRTWEYRCEDCGKFTTVRVWERI